MATTTHASLTDRYVMAVLPGVPAEQRAATEARLRDAIGASVAQRVAGGQSVDNAERAVLTELGDPMRVAAAQSGRELHLIGPALYPSYVRLLRLLLSIVVPIVGVVVGAASAIGGADLGPIVVSAVGTAFTVGVQVAFWVTVAFALADRYGSRDRARASTWDVDDLPEPPSSGVSLGDTVGSIVGLALLAWFLLWQPGYQESFDPGGPSIPILDPALEAFWIPVLVAILLASIVLEIVLYLRGRWTVPLAVANTVLGLAFAIPAVWLASTDQLLNPEFLAAITVDAVASIVAGTPALVAWIIVVVSAIDIGSGWWKALRSRPGTRWMQHGGMSG
jgi:hypothetical protein